ncbi:MAG: hypothetical protein HUK22_05770 [Thermoguttaceae bacterium]|nr:hypothetical protein [Thermoguttaceae bacterium]
MTFREIAEELGCSEVHAGHLVKKHLKSIAPYLRNDDELLQIYVLYDLNEREG